MEKETPEKVDAEMAEQRKDADRLYELIKRCNDQKKPDSKARKELKDLIQNSETAQVIMQSQTGLFNYTLRERIERFPCSDSFREVVHFKCRKLQEDLGHSNASQLEKLAINQIVLCWLNLHLIEISLTDRLANQHERDSGIYWEKRLNFASQRYNRALETLSKMRKMNLTLQINQAQNQIVNNKGA